MMDEDKSKCGHALTCEQFFCKVSTRNHHVRLTMPCLAQGSALCPIPSGQACSIDKMRKLRNELKTSGLSKTFPELM